MKRILPTVLTLLVLAFSGCKSEKIGKGFLPDTSWDVEAYYLYYTTLDTLNSTKDLSKIRGAIATTLNGSWTFSKEDEATLLMDYDFEAIQFGGSGTYELKGKFVQDKRQSHFVVEASDTLEEFFIHQRNSRKDIWVKWDSTDDGESRVHMVHLLRK